MATAGDFSKIPVRPRSFLAWLRLWLLLRDPVGRREYAITGFGLMALKYVVEFAAVSAISGQLYTPLDFVNPLMDAREQFVRGAPDWFGIVWVLWTLPFLWIALSMSVRRALDAGDSPWLGLAVLVPLLNLCIHRRTIAINRRVCRKWRFNWPTSGAKSASGCPTTEGPQ